MLIEEKMSRQRSDFNVVGGLVGIGEDMLLEIIREMHSIRDVQNVWDLFCVFESCRLLKTKLFFFFFFSLLVCRSKRLP